MMRRKQVNHVDRAASHIMREISNCGYGYNQDITSRVASLCYKYDLTLTQEEKLVVVAKVTDALKVRS